MLSDQYVEEEFRDTLCFLDVLSSFVPSAFHLHHCLLVVVLVLNVLL